MANRGGDKPQRVQVLVTGYAVNIYHKDAVFCVSCHVR